MSFRNDHPPVQSLAGCLRNVETLLLETIRNPAENLPLLFYGNLSSREPPLRLRKFVASAPNNLEQKFLEFFAEHCPSLTELHFTFIFMDTLNVLPRLTSLQHLVLGSSVHDCLSIVQWCAALNFEEVEKTFNFIVQRLPPHLASDLSKVRMGSFSPLVQSSLSSILLFAANSEERIKNVSTLDNPQSALMAFCLLQHQFVFNSEYSKFFVELKLKKLIELGADPFRLVHVRANPAFTWPTTLFHLAVAHSITPIVQRLFGVIDSSDYVAVIERLRDAEGLTPLHVLPSRDKMTWLSCFDWHKSNISGWKLTDKKNTQKMTPLASLLSCPIDWFSTAPTLRTILAHILLHEPDLFDQREHKLLFASIIKTFTHSSEDASRFASVTEAIWKTITRNSQDAITAEDFGFNHQVRLSTYSCLLRSCVAAFSVMARNQPLTFFGDLAQLISSQDQRFETSRSVWHVLFDCAAAAGHSVSSLTNCEGVSLLQISVSAEDHNLFVKLLSDYEPDPLYLSSTEVMQAITDLIRGKLPNRCKGISDHTLEKLIRKLLKSDRPREALFIIESRLIYQCQQLWISNNQKAAREWLKKKNTLVEALFDDAHILAMFDTPQKDLVPTLLFILLSPLKLAHLTKQKRLDISLKLIAQLDETNSSSSSPNATSFSDLFFSAAITLVQDEAARRKDTLTILGALADVFEQIPLESIVLSQDCIDYFEEISTYFTETPLDKSGKSSKLFDRIFELMDNWSCLGSQ